MCTDLSTLVGMTLFGAKPLEELPARERVLSAAHDLFYRDGICATGIDRIIAHAGVTKTTFYRHFPSKNDLVTAYMAFRHERWMAWFQAALQRHGGCVDAVVPALKEWFADDGFRGCAFINGVGELGGHSAEVVALSRAHKDEMIDAIAALMPRSRQRNKTAQVIGMAIDGAIVRAQLDQSADAALRTLKQLVNAVAEQ